jgi:probable F420-dependent oxidoreductase
MELGLVLQTNPPARRVIELAAMAEDLGFSHVWTFDSTVLWEEPFVIYSQILARTHSVLVGPMVTNPLSRDWAVTASCFATLNEMFGNRTICGIGRGDSAVRVTGAQPASLSLVAEAAAAIKGLAEGRTVVLNGRPVRLPWVVGGRLDVLMAAYGPRALACAGRHADGLIVQLADPAIVEWAAASARRARHEAGRGSSPFRLVAAAPAYVGDDLVSQRAQLRWFGGMVGNHVADLVARYGASSADLPRVLTDYVAQRPAYDYAHHGRAGNPTAEFVPDEVVDRFCVLGPIGAHLERLEQLAALGVDQFALYLMHDDMEATLRAYGRHVVARLR